MIAQHVVWIKKAFFNSKDNWSYDLKSACHGNAIAISRSCLNVNRHPVLFGLTESFELFKTAFTSLNDNFLKALIANNPDFVCGRNDTRLLDTNFFRQNPNLDMAKIFRLTFEQVANKEGMLRLDEINESLGLNLNLVTYLRLGESLTFFLRSRTNQSFYLSLKKGLNRSVKYLRIIETEISN